MVRTAQIATPSIDETLPPGARRLRRRAPDHLLEVLRRTNVPGVDLQELRAEQIEVLGGGVDAATYLIKTGTAQYVVKLSDKNLDAEAEALAAWRERHVRVPRIIAYGAVPGTARGSQVWYVVQQALVNTNGRVVETCAELLVRDPTQARAVGRLLGRELAKLHRTTTDRSFGEYGSSGNGKPYASWNTYCLGFLDAQAAYLRHLGVTDVQLEAIGEYIAAQSFVRPGRYIHGDFSIRNAAVKSYEPLKLYLFDPNPMVGDPGWDLAVPFNNYEFQKRRLAYDDTQHELFVRDQQVLIGLRQGYQRTIREPALLVAQLLQASLQAGFKEPRRRRNPDEALDFRVRKEFILHLADRLSRAGAS